VGRAEGHYELLADVLVACSGTVTGTYYSGLEVESYSPLVPLTSRTLDSGSAATEAMLVINDAAPEAQVLCTAPFNPAVCPGANVFPGIRVSPTKIRFAFPMAGAQVLRITNLRAALSQFGVAPGASEQGRWYVRETTTGVPTPQLSLSLATTTIVLTLAERGILVSPPSPAPAFGCADVNPELAQDPSAFATSDGRNFVVRVSERSFPSMFRPRNTASPAPGADPPPVLPQSFPGVTYVTETGFYNPFFPGVYANAGLAASGSRVFLRIHGVPNGVKLFVPSRLTLKKNEVSSPIVDTGFAKRVITDPDGAGDFLALPATSAIGGGIAQMTALGAYHQAVYEIADTDTLSFESVDVPIYPAYLASSGASGAMTVTAGFAPLSPDITGESTITPRFQDYSTAQAVAQFNGCSGFTITPQSNLVAASGGTGSITVAPPPNTAWTAASNDAWITITAGGSSSQGNTLSYAVGPNPFANPRAGTITIGPVTFTINQLAGPATAVQLVPAQAEWGGGNSGISTFTVVASEPWTAVSNAAWLVVISTTSNEVRYSVALNPTPNTRVGTITVNSATFTVTQGGYVPPLGRDLSYVPVTPCRVMDTRGSPGAFGQPALAASTPRSFTLWDSPCAIPLSAKAYAFNVTVVPKGTLGFLTIWPAGFPQPFVSTLNSPDGRIKANAAIVPAGANGAVNVMATDATELIVDINGYFVEGGSSALAFYPLPPCRLLDTRSGAGPLGGPVLANGSTRSFPVRNSNCGVPATAQAYSVNATVVPSGALGYLTLWPTGQAQPFVSTLNSPKGSIVANAAIVPAGTNGAISAFVTDQTHLVIDINGYFAPAGTPGSLRFNALAPCRVLDTRNANGVLGGPILASGQARSWPVPQSACELPNGAGAYSMNATVVPAGRLDYLTMWPAGQAQPFVSTLNAADDPIVANALLVPAGTAGSVSSYVTNQTHLVLDVNGYFAP
jgi:hypothetical protein